MDRGEWGILMNAVLTSSQRGILIEKLRRHYDEQNIINRNMPFIARKVDTKQPKVNDYRGVLQRLDTIYPPKTGGDRQQEPEQHIFHLNFDP